MPYASPSNLCVINGRAECRFFLSHMAHGRHKKPCFKRGYIVFRGNWFNRRCAILHADRTWKTPTVLLVPGPTLLVFQGCLSGIVERRKPIAIFKDGRVNNAPHTAKVQSEVAALRRKQTVPQRCELCDRETKLVGHHWRGYDFPSDVWWICGMCNVALIGPEAHSGVLTKTEARALMQSDVVQNGGDYSRRRIHVVINEETNSESQTGETPTPPTEAAKTAPK